MSKPLATKVSTRTFSKVKCQKWAQLAIFSHWCSVTRSQVCLIVFSLSHTGHWKFSMGWQPCRPIWCSVRRMVWALTGWPPTASTSAAMLATFIRLFPKHNFWIWCWACALNFFGRPWRSLFWEEPVLLNRCLVLATVLQLSFRVLAIFL